ncbi:type I restriction-modification system subunit M [Vibrio sp. ZSDE26]|uniref:site-specific DNA-methyltransferase (adenine-specific) n=1 Tax=Vibrio amylolyticus TaxID=2847292 RepID=A0A9X1XKP9_9VIBR|nr:class I SAM-dependent DNA methyltransferase [Vibrio amylolyticus]MCK6263940.1 type I restriction-modification system subunit M [Vibrio amylolyticus]
MKIESQFAARAAFLWSVADLLRGDFKQSQYGRIILPFTLLRRLECVLEANKPDVLSKYDDIKEMPFEAQNKLLTHIAKLSFYNTSQMDLNRLGETGVASNLEHYIQSFSPNVREIFDHFDFCNTIDKLEKADLLYKVAKRFATADLHPKALNNHGMGLIFEELIRRVAERSNDTAREHFTPRDIVDLTTSLLFANEEALNNSGLVRSIYDPTAGTGGFLSSSMEYVLQFNRNAELSAFGQELNPESYAICKADMLIKGQNIDNIKLGNTLSNDQLRTEKFDYMLSNPPLGVGWKKIQKCIYDEHKEKGFGGRFGAGLPRVSDGSLLFLMHLVSKMRPRSNKISRNDSGSRIGIILNGSPLFTGGAGSGESEIRRYILENDLLETIVALPADIFYNTGIATYVWLLSSHKAANRKGKVQLINATKEHAKKGGRTSFQNTDVDDEVKDEHVFYQAMRKSLGCKRRELTEDGIEIIVNTYGHFIENDVSKIVDYRAFGYRRITVDRPLKLAIYPKDESRLIALQADKTWLKLASSVQSNIKAALSCIEKEKQNSRDTFLTSLNLIITGIFGGTKLTAAQQKLIVKHLGEHDDEAEVCLHESGKAKGTPEANPALRDYENVPLTQTVGNYFVREVLPRVSDAWIDINKKDPLDGAVGIVGYEIDFNHFDSKEIKSLRPRNRRRRFC